MGRVVAVLLIAAGVVSACGSSSRGTIDSLLKRPGPDVAVTAGAGSFLPGPVRFPFLVNRKSKQKVVLWGIAPESGKVVVHKGQKVTFVNNMSMGAPHTVTFGIPHAGPGILDAYGNPANYKGGDLSSSIIPPHGRFTVTFNKVGTYSYICLLHSQLGMVGKVVVTK